MTELIGMTMRAVRQPGYGTSEVWEIGREPVSRPGPGRVLVEVTAAGLDHGTWHLLTGKPYLMRLATGFTKPRRVVPGLDLAGRVVAIGAGVTRFGVGDEVFGIGEGSLAEYTIAREEKLSLRPACWTAAQAAAVPVSGLTAWQALHESAGVAAGHRVLVTGASGGVGSYAVQLAVAAGAEVTALCSGTKTDFVRGLGAQRVLDYRCVSLADLADNGTPGEQFDIVLDIGGRADLRLLRRLTTRGGTVVLVGGDDKNVVFGPLGRSLRGVAWSPLAGVRFAMLVATEHHAGLDAMAELGEAGRLTPAVDRVVPLDQAADAIAALGAGQVRGKVVIEVASRD